jgi:hypothetical protein
MTEQLTDRTIAPRTMTDSAGGFILLQREIENAAKIERKIRRLWIATVASFVLFLVFVIANKI